MNKELITEKVIMALKIRDEIRKMFTDRNIQIYPSIGADVNPFYNQTDETKEGIIIECYYSSLSKIYTPLGYISINGPIALNSNTVKAINEIEEVFGFNIYRDIIKNTMGYFGPIIYATKLPWSEDIIKHDEGILRKSDEYIEYSVAKQMFDEILTMYENNPVII